MLTCVFFSIKKCKFAASKKRAIGFATLLHGAARPTHHVAIVELKYKICNLKSLKTQSNARKRSN